MILEPTKEELEKELLMLSYQEEISEIMDNDNLTKEDVAKRTRLKPEFIQHLLRYGCESSVFKELLMELRK